MGQPLFSVLIANYNNGKYLQEAIDSVFSQTYTNWEVIIVDDGSTDESRTIYANLEQDSRIHIYYNDKNEGCGYTKNRCVWLSTGEICGFLDPDDELLPNALELMVAHHCDHPEISIIYSRCYYCDKDGKTTGESKLLELQNNQTYFDYRWYGAMNFASFKRDYYNQTDGISIDAKAGIDQDLYFKVEEKGAGPMVLNEFTYRYYIGRNEKAITSSNNLSNLWFWNLEVRRMACLRRGLPVYEIIRKDFGHIIENIEKETGYIAEMKVRNSFAYKLGKFLINPIKMLRRPLILKKMHRGGDKKI